MRYFILLLLLPFFAQSQTNIYGKQIFKDSVKFEKPFKFSGAYADTNTSIILKNHDLLICNSDTTTAISVTNDDIGIYTNNSFNVQSGTDVVISSLANSGFYSQGDIGLSSQGDVNVNSQGIASISAQGDANITANGSINMDAGISALISVDSSFEISTNQNRSIGEFGVSCFYNNSTGDNGFFTRKEKTWDAGYYTFIDGGVPKAQLFYGTLDTNNIITDVTRIEVNPDAAHGRHISNALAGNYNGWHVNEEYAQLEYNKSAEDGQASGTLAVVDSTGFSFYRNGSDLAGFDNSGNVYAANILSGSATLDFGTITANGHETLTFSVSGASVGDVVSLGIPDASMDAHASFIAWVSATNTVSVKCFNFDGSSFNPASGVFKVKIFK